MKHIAHIDRRELIENWHMDATQTVLRALHRLGGPVDCFLDFLFDPALRRYHALIVFVQRTDVMITWTNDPEGNFILSW